jgi:hypothetical protein
LTARRAVVRQQPRHPPRAQGARPRIAQPPDCRITFSAPMPLENHYLRGPSHAVLRLARNSDLWHPGPSAGSKRRCVPECRQLGNWAQRFGFPDSRIERTKTTAPGRELRPEAHGSMLCTSSLASSPPATHHGLLSKRSSVIVEADHVPKSAKQPLSIGNVNRIFS